MAKASDLMNKSGSADFGMPTPAPAGEVALPKGDQPAQRSHDRTRDAAPQGGAKAKGGAGQSSARPKV